LILDDGILDGYNWIPSEEDSLNDGTLTESESVEILDDDERTFLMKAQIIGFQIQNGSL
jgi:hypothetical protein